MKRKQRLISLITSLFMVISMVGVLPVMTASALTYGDYEYAVNSNGTVKITSYNGMASIVSIPSTIGNKTVSRIGNNAFKENSRIKQVTIPEGVTSIGDFAFASCDSLTNITIPNSVTSIGKGAFDGCERLTSITIPNSVKSIGEGTFYRCESLTSITIPNSVKSIGEGTFYRCESLTSITVDSNNKNYSSANGVLFNKNKTELIQYPIGNTRTSYTIPNSVKSIGNYAFKYCSSLTSVTIPTSVKSVGNSAFQYCYNIKNVYYKGSQAQWKNISFGDNNKSLKTANVHFAVATITVPTVTGLKVAATSAQAVKLTCNKVSGATGYVYYRANAGKWVKIGVSKTNTFTETKLKSGTSYRYAVKAYKTANGKNYYSASYPTLWTSTNPATVSFTVAGGVKKAVLKWSKTNGATGYKVYYKTSAKGKWVGLKTTNNKTTSYTKTGLTKGKTYYFTVKAYRTVNGKTYNGAFVTKSVKVK